MPAEQSLPALSAGQIVLADWRGDAMPKEPNKRRRAAAVGDLFRSLPEALVILLALAAPVRGWAKDLTIQEWADTFVKSCVGSGGSYIASGTVAANGGISLRTLALSGQIKGEVVLTRKESSLLSDGISDAMSQVEADEMDKVRECLAPLRIILAFVMQSQFASGTHELGSPFPILSPYENKIMQIMAVTGGFSGDIGRDVHVSTLKLRSALGDIRFRIAVRALETQSLVMPSLDVTMKGTAILQEPSLSLSSDGDSYVEEVGFAK